MHPEEGPDLSRHVSRPFVCAEPGTEGGREGGGLPGINVTLIPVRRSLRESEREGGKKRERERERARASMSRTMLFLTYSLVTDISSLRHRRPDRARMYLSSPPS